MATRRSERIVHSSRDGPPESKDEDYHSHSEPEGKSEDEAPKRKKAKTGGKRKASDTHAQSGLGKAPAPKRQRGDRGLLKNVVDMPLDIVFEIFGKLSPGDLLNLAQTSKDLRRILMSRSSASVWKEARQNEPGLPDCPVDLTEPQYADLCFGKRCTNCARTRISVTYTVWSARVRLCKSCLDEMCESHYPAMRGIHDSAIANLMPSIAVKKAGRWRYREKRFHKASVDKWNEQSKSKTEEEQAILWNELKVKHEHGEACNAWFSKRNIEISFQRASTIDQRRDLIIDHARKLGWDDEFELSSYALDAIKQSDILRKACSRNVTAKVLANLEDTIDEVLQAAQTRRLAAAKETLLRNRLTVFKEVFQECLKKLSPARPLPTPRQIYAIPRIRDLIINTPPDTDMTAGDFSPVTDDFTALVEEWQTRISANLVGLIKKSYEPQHIVDEDTVLELATTVFICTRCGKHFEHIYYPRALSHACNVASYGISGYSRPEPETLSPEEQAEDWVLRSMLQEGRWNYHKNLTVEADITKLMGEVVELCGFDRHTTTRAEMDAADPIIECLSCHKEGEGRAVMSWRTVVDHWGKVHSQKYKSGYEYEPQQTMTLRALDDPKEVDRMRSELALQQEKDAARHKTSACAECHLKETSAQLKKHLKYDHTRPAGEGDILPQLDANHFHQVYYSWPPRDDEEHALLTLLGTDITVTKGWASTPATE